MWSWIAGFSSIVVLVLMGNKWRWAPLFGVGVQVTWFIYVFVEHQWGLMPCVIAYTIVHIRNSRKWLKETPNQKGR